MTSKKKIIHRTFRQLRGYDDYTNCGKVVSRDRSTSNWPDVTCKICKKSKVGKYTSTRF